MTVVGFVRLIRDFALLLVFMGRYLRNLVQGGRLDALRRVVVAVVSFSIMVVFVVFFGRNSSILGDFQSFVKIPVFFVAIFLMLRFAFDLPIKSSVLESLILTIVLRAGQGLYSATFAYFSAADSVFQSDGVETVLVFVIDLCLVLALAPKEGELVEESIAPAHIAMLVFAAFYYLVTHSASYTGPLPAWSAIVSFVQCVCMLAFCFLAKRMVANDARRRSVQRMNSLMEVEYAQMLQRQRSDQQIRAVYHDVKQALSALSSQEDTTAAAQTMASLKDELANLRSTPYAKSPILNMLLNEKADAARRQHTRLEVNVNCGDCSYLDDYDVVTIFGNLLSNALEATAKLACEDDRWVRFEAAEVRSLQVFRVSNPFEGEVVRKGGVFATSKDDGRFHGLGLENVHRRVAHYRGAMRVEEEGGVFSVTISFPLADEGADLEAK